jgi:hypothetical protein
MVHRQSNASSPVVRRLEEHHRDPRPLHIRTDRQQGLNGRGIHPPFPPRQRMNQRPGDGGDAAGLGDDAVAFGFRDHDLARCHLSGHRDEIRHRAGREKERVLLAEQRRDLPLQRLLQRVLAQSEPVRRRCRLGHGRDHLRRRRSQEVAAQVEDHHPSAGTARP